MISFTEWLSYQRYRRDMVGEFADQVARRHWPPTSDFLVLRVRMSLENASPRAKQAMTTAWAEWECSKHLPQVNVFANFSTMNVN